MSLLPRRTPGEPPALSLRHLSKRFGSSLVLDDVALDVMPGEVHGLLGQNGSGKSTLIKILAGFHDPEPGAELLMAGESAPLPMPPGLARRLGISFVHQHLALIPSLSVVENLLIGELATSHRLAIDWSRERARAAAVFARFGLTIDPAARIADLPQAERALVAIVRAFEDINPAVQRGGGVLVLDEPTPFLPRAGVDQLFALVREVARAGAAVIFVSHDIDEIREITDRATVLRDGRLAGTLVSREASAEAFVELIIGRRVSLYHAPPRDGATRPVAMSVRAATGATVRDVNLDVHEGEIVGLTGLIGSGFDELPYLLHGAQRARSGTLTIGGSERPLSAMSPRDAIAAGLALLPSDRLGAAGVGSLSLADNISLPVLADFRRWFGLDWGGIGDRTEALGRRYEVRPNDPDAKLSSLSGGNAQKVLMAKWLQTEPRLLMLDEPTQGVDVGARQALFAALGDAAGRGTAILVASTDTEQLAQICDRVLVFGRGRVVQELRGEAVAKDTISAACLLSAGAAVMEAA